MPLIAAEPDDNIFWNFDFNFFFKIDLIFSVQLETSIYPGSHSVMTYRIFRVFSNP
jgi:hypothetical protein